MIFWEQVIHLLYGFLILVAIGAFAVALELGATYVKSLGVSDFTFQTLMFTAHGLMISDLVLFSLYLLVTGIRAIRGLFHA